MALVNLVDPVCQYWDKAGRPLSGGRVYTRVGGTQQSVLTYADNGTPFSTLNPWPIILDQYGRCRIWVDDGVSVRLDIHDSNDDYQESRDYCPPITSTAVILSAIAGMRTKAGPATRSVTTSINADDVGRLINVNGGSCALPGLSASVDGAVLLVHAFQSTNMTGTIYDINGNSPPSVSIGAGGTYAFLADWANSRWQLIGRM